MSDDGAEKARRVRLEVRRQDAADKPGTRRIEKLETAWSRELTVAGALRQLEREMPNAPGWEAGCLEGDCGACAMLVNGQVRQACTTLVDEVSPKGKSILLEPLSKLPLVRDLVVDRGPLRSALASVRAGLDVEWSEGHVADCAVRDQPAMLALSRCTDCGACLEACPQWGEHSDFVGAASLNEVRRLALYPARALEKAARLEAVMVPGGIADCGKAQNCVEVCPMGIPLVDSLQTLSRETSKQLLSSWLFG